MKNTNFNKARVLIEYFGIYGRGNFDLTVGEINTILDVLNKRQDKEEIRRLLKQLYEILSKKRMG